MPIFFIVLAIMLLCIFWHCYRSIKRDRAIYGALEEAIRSTPGVPVQVAKRSNPEEKGVRSTVPFELAGKKLILTGRGFYSAGVAKQLTDGGGQGTLWETTLEGQRIALLESAGLKYWGAVTEEYHLKG